MALPAGGPRGIRPWVLCGSECAGGCWVPRQGLPRWLVVWTCLQPRTHPQPQPSSSSTFYPAAPGPSTWTPQSRGLRGLASVFCLAQPGLAVLGNTDPFRGAPRANRGLTNSGGKRAS